MIVDSVLTWSGILFRVWHEGNLIGTFYQNPISHDWVVRPVKIDKLPLLSIAFNDAIAVLEVKSA